MKHLLTAGGAVVLLCHFSFAAISNWNFPNDQSFQPSDSIHFAYSCDRDTTITRIYLETGDGASGLDTSQDGLLFSIMMIDNNTEERWGNEKGLMADGNPADGEYLFNPGRTGLPPGLYIVQVSDHESATVDTFRVVAFTSTYRTVSGKVTPPDGEDAAYIQVDLQGMNLDYSLGAWTNATGDYTIAVDQATVNATAGKMKVRINARFDGYLPTPEGQDVDLSAGNKQGVDFKYLKATCVVSGTVRADNAGVADVRVVLLNSSYNPVSSIGTNENGYYKLYGTAGSYVVRAEVGKSAGGYLAPKEVKIDLKDGDSVMVNFDLPKADAFIYGRITVKGAAPSMTLAVSAHNESYGGTWSTTDTGGYFTIPVVAAAQKYNVSLDNRGDYPIPEKLIIENGKNWVEVAVGDTVRFNLIDKPTGGIGGSIVNATNLTAKRFFIRVYSSDSQKNVSYQFESMQSGSYTFDGIPAGTYFAEAGMSVAGGDEFQWKIHARYTDETGKMMSITIADTIIGGIDWKFTDADTITGPINETKGTATLLLSVTDATGSMFEKGMILLVENLPGPDQPVKPLRTYQLDTGSEVMTLTEVPNKKVYVMVEIAGRADSVVERFMTFVKNDDGSPRALDFSTSDTLTAAVKVMATDKMQNTGGPVEPVGNGKVSGKVTYTGSLPTDKLYALLYDAGRDDWIRGVGVASDGSYTIDKVPAGKFRVAAAIDTNGDHQAEAIAINDSVLVFTDKEVYENINVALVDKKTGTGSISGTLTSAQTLPNNVEVIVAAIPIDTTRPDSDQLNMVALMMGYHTALKTPGDYTLGGLPAGVYYVVAMVETPMDTSGKMAEVAFGVYGTLLTDSSAEFPFNPTPVIVPDGQKIESIAITLIPHVKDNIPVITARRSDIPQSFSMNAPVVSRSTGSIVLRFGIPERALIGFSVVDLRGRIVTRIAQKEYAAGYHSVGWDLSASGKGLTANGTYVLLLRSNRYTSHQILRIIR